MLKNAAHEVRNRAYQLIKANGGAAGIDGQTVEDFEERLKDNLYKLWNRMSSGSYYPKAVRRVEIPKKSGDRQFAFRQPETPLAYSTVQQGKHASH